MNRSSHLLATCALLATSTLTSYAATVYVGGGTTSTSTDVQYLMQYEWTDGLFTKTAGANPGAIADIALGDLNGDQSRDLVISMSSGSGNNIRYYLGSNITGTIKTSTTYQTGTKQLVVGDLNNDGYADVVTKSGTNVLSFMKGSTTGLPTAHTLVQQNAVYNNSAITLIDATGSGRADYVAIGRNDNYGIEFRKIDSAGTNLTSDNAIAPPSSAIQTGTVNPASLLAGHFTSSTGRQDLIVVTNIGNAGDDVLYYQNNGNGFSSKGSLATSGVLSSRLPGTVGDINGDQLDDAILLASNSLLVYSFSLSGSDLIKTITNNISLAAYGTAVTCEAIDLNADGRSDVLIGFNNGNLVAFVSDSNGILNYNASIATGQTSLTSIAAAPIPEAASLSVLGGAALAFSLRRPQHTK